MQNLRRLMCFDRKNEKKELKKINFLDQSESWKLEIIFREVN